MPRKAKNDSNLTASQTDRAGRHLVRITRSSVVDRHQVQPGGDQDDIDTRASLWEQMKACDLGDPEDCKRYDELEAEYDELDAKIEAASKAAPRSFFGGGATSYAKNRPLAADQSFRGAVSALGLDFEERERNEQFRDDGQDPSFGHVLRNALRDNRLDIVDAMSGGSSGAGGYLLPTILTADIVDLARNRTRVLEAGARVVPMANRKVQVPTWEDDPDPAWRAENGPIAEDDGEIGSIELNAKSLAVIVKVSRELIEDTNVDDELLDAFAARFALKLDTAALYGPGALAPRGLKEVTAVPKTPLATNGAPPTWDALVDSVGRLRDKNYDPNAQILADRTMRSLAKQKETGTGAYLAAPDYLDGVSRLSTGQVPTNLTVGTGTDTSDVFTGQWNQLYVGVRTSLQISLLKERYADTGQVGFVAWFRGDIVPARPAAFDIVTGVKA